MFALNPREGLLDTVNWLQKAFPEPTSKNVSTQIGVHFEEVGEFIETLKLTHTDNTVADDMRKVVQKAYEAVNDLSKMCKSYNCIGVNPELRTEYLDAICDQIVTATGCAHMTGMDVIGAFNEVNRSNFSKFDENGNPVFDENLKLIKSENYSPAQLELFAHE